MAEKDGLRQAGRPPLNRLFCRFVRGKQPAKPRYYSVFRLKKTERAGPKGLMPERSHGIIYKIRVDGVSIWRAD